MIQSSFRGLSILAAAIFLCCTPAVSQRTTPLPDLSSKRLLNDLQVTVARASYMGSDMAIGLVIRYGAYFDPAGKGGVANLLSRMFMKAALDKTAKDIQDELAYLEATVDVQCDWDGIRFILRGQSSKVERSLLLLFQIVGEAQFNDADFAEVKQSILASLQKSPDPRQRIRSQLENALLRGTNHARPLAGTLKSVSGITIGDIRYFYRKFFSPSQAALIVVGDVPPHIVLQRASRIWGVWVRNDDVPFTFLQPRRPGGRQIYIEDDPNSPAAQFIMGNLFPPREDPAYGSALITALIFQERLTKLMPASLLTVGNTGRRMVSPFYVQGQAAADQAVDQILKIENIAEEMKTSLASKEELGAVQKIIVESFERQLSTAGGLINVLLDSELYRLGSNYAASYADQIRRCDAEAVKQAAQDFIFPEGKIILVRGPAAVLKPVLSPLGTIQPLPSDF
jgi:zinc protease